jgi:L-asparaginase
MDKNLIPPKKIGKKRRESMDEHNKKPRIGSVKLPFGVPGFPNRKPKIAYLPIGGAISLEGTNLSKPRNVEIDPPSDSFSNVASESIFSRELLQLRDEVIQKIAQHDSLVISHPPETLTNIAWFLRLTLSSDQLQGKKVIFTSTANDPDGIDAQINLARAYHLAKNMKEDGVFIEDGGQIFCPPYVRNTHTIESHPFKPINGREIGLSSMGSPRIQRQPEVIPTFDVAGVTELPTVNVVRVQPGDPDETIRLIDDAVRLGASALVIGATGNGTVHDAVEAHLAELAAGGNGLTGGAPLPVVFSTVVGEGEVSRNGAVQHDANNFVCSGKLGPEEACMQVRVALAAKPALTIAELQAAFEPYQTPSPTIDKGKGKGKETSKAETEIQQPTIEPTPAASVGAMEFSFDERAEGSTKDVDISNDPSNDPMPTQEQPVEATNAPGRRHAKISGFGFSFKLPFTIPFTQKLPKVLILVAATGGTISSGGSATTYSPELGGKELVAGTGKPANTKIDVIDVYKKDSKNLEYVDLFKLRNSILEKFNQYDSVVITHGTDTLAYTANFLRHTLPDEVFNKISVVITGSMVPTALKDSQGPKIKPDGPKNMRNAFTLADFNARLSKDGRTEQNAVYTVLNKLCFDPPSVEKKHTHSVAAFSGGDKGPVGEIHKNTPTMRRAPEERKWEFDVGDAKELPRVSVFHIEPGNPPGNTIARIKAALDRGVQGVVIAAPGKGKVPAEVETYLHAVVNAGQSIVVRATSANFGPVPPKQEDGNIISAGNLNPDMARQFVQLALLDPNARAKGRNTDSVAEGSGQTQKTRGEVIAKVQAIFADYQPNQSELGQRPKQTKGPKR